MLKLVRLNEFARRKPDQLSGDSASASPWRGRWSNTPTAAARRAVRGARPQSCASIRSSNSVNIQERLGITFIMVTHDQEEAMTMSTRMAVMNEGRIRQIGTPSEIYEFPSNRFVAGFIGAVNQFEAVWSNSRMTC